MLEISEIMYDLKTGSDDGREWIEIRNISNEIFDLSKLIFFEGDTNHKIKIIQGDIKLFPQSYAVITSSVEKFKTDYPNFLGIILDSTFSLNNSGEMLALKNREVTLDQYIYNSGLGGSGDGKSLQKINGVWSASNPTPGIENKKVENKIILSPISIPKPKIISPSKNIISSGENNRIITPSKAKFELPILTQRGEENNNLVANANFVTQENSNLYFFISILFFLISIGVVAVYFIRRKKISPMAGDDFEILED